MDGEKILQNLSNGREKDVNHISHLYDAFSDNKDFQEVKTKTSDDLGLMKTSMSNTSLGVRVPNLIDIYGKTDEDKSRLTITGSNDLPSKIQEKNHDDAETGGLEVRYEPKNSNREYWMQYKVLTARGKKETSENLSPLHATLVGLNISNVDHTGTSEPITFDYSRQEKIGKRVDKIEFGFLEEIVEINKKRIGISASIGPYAEIYGDFNGDYIQNDVIHESLNYTQYDLKYEDIDGITGGIAGRFHLETTAAGKINVYTTVNARVNVIGSVRNTGEAEIVGGGILDLGKGVNINIGLVGHYIESNSGYDVIDYVAQDKFTKGITGGIKWDINEKVGLALQTANTIKGRQNINDSSLSVVISF